MWHFLLANAGRGKFAPHLVPRHWRRVDRPFQPKRVTSCEAACPLSRKGRGRSLSRNPWVRTAPLSRVRGTSSTREDPAHGSSKEARDSGMLIVRPQNFVCPTPGTTTKSIKLMVDPIGRMRKFLPTPPPAFRRGAGGGVAGIITGMKSFPRAASPYWSCPTRWSARFGCCSIDSVG